MLSLTPKYRIDFILVGDETCISWNVNGVRFAFLMPIHLSRSPEWTLSQDEEEDEEAADEASSAATACGFSALMTTGLGAMSYLSNTRPLH